jgi:hypothetical protein
MTQEVDDLPRVLIPFDRREALSVSQAAQVAGKSERTLRLWCALYDIGRRVGGGRWQVSRVALMMMLDGDAEALRAYLSGDRSSEGVARYFERSGCPLPEKRCDG